TDQEVEGEREQRKAHALHQEQWIGEERRRDQHGEQHHEGDGLALRAEHRGLLRERIGHVLHHVLRPNSPAGRTSSTIAITTKITVFEASGEKTLVRPSTTPRPKPEMMAPR